MVGGESAAADGALTLAEIAGTVHLICDDLKVSDVLLGKLENSRVVVHRGAKIREIAGGEQVSALVLDDGTTLSTTGVFIELGAKGLMELATSLGVALDDDMRFIQTDKGQRTSVPGIFAAGDICGPPWQVAKAVDGGVWPVSMRPIMPKSIRAADKIKCPILLVFWSGYGVASMAPYNKYETIDAPCSQTKIRRNLRSIYFFRGSKSQGTLWFSRMALRSMETSSSMISTPFCDA